MLTCLILNLQGCKLKITNIGSGAQHTVVPETWLGREFANADELHAEMSKLEWRQNDPPVRWCCTFGMRLESRKLWLSKSEINTMTHCKFGIRINKIDDPLTFHEFCNITSFNEWVCATSNASLFLNKDNLIIGCVKENIFNASPEYADDIKMSVLVSQLQKCFRRGTVCARLLNETIGRINKCKPYNLPEHNFTLVSGSKQLLWRTYISIIEDISPYTGDDKKLIGMDRILAMALMCNIDPTLQINNEVLEKVKNTALAIQSYPKKWNWSSAPLKRTILPIDITTENNVALSMQFALEYMPKMKGDEIMLKKSIEYIKTFEMPKLTYKSPSNFIKQADKVQELACRYEAIDMHCCPDIILLVQGSLPAEDVGKIATKDIPGIIWDNISRLNCRKATRQMQIQIVTIVREIQKHLFRTKYSKDSNNIVDPPIKTELDAFAKSIEHCGAIKKKVDNIDNIDIPENIKRIAFLSLFGKKILVPKQGKFKTVDVIVGGDKNDPFKIKCLSQAKTDAPSSTKSFHTFIEGNEKQNYVKHVFNAIGTTKCNTKIITQMLTPIPRSPMGFSWSFKKKRKLIISMKMDENENIEFCVDGTVIPAFDAGPLLVKNPEPVEIDANEDSLLLSLIRHALYVKNIDDVSQFGINLSMRYLHTLRKDDNNTTLFKWSNIKKQCFTIPSEVWHILYSRIIGANKVNIGPVDRSGEKTQNAISHKYEGICWRLMNMLAMIYPTVIKIVRDYSFAIDDCQAEYKHLMQMLQTEQSVDDSKKTQNEVVPKIKTKLWDHQQNARDKIVDGILVHKKLGHCDASSVGSGKTLTAICAVAKLMSNDINGNSKGALILLPSEKLYRTWEDEITKHTTEFTICKQHANGTFDSPIERNTIVITTLGRMRDHPIVHKWLYVVIDECLSVQNSSSLHTEEAWRQVTNSKYGVLLLSASFFRSRFNKLLYMLKMLRTGLPEEIEYLDSILNYAMVCNLNKNSRKWTTNINYFPLAPSIREKYNKIQASTHSNEDKYIQLTKLMYTECDYIKCFKNVIDSSADQHRFLIYTRSKQEADKLSEHIDDVSRYPDKSKKHVVVSYVEGTFGLNDLVIYNTILTRPPDADKLPQMKGRLDRPNQTSNTLQLEYVLFKHTIEEAMLHKLEMAKNFYGQYILPLAEFYKIALSFGKMQNK